MLVPPALAGHSEPSRLCQDVLFSLSPILDHFKPWRPRSEYPLRSGIRSITLHHSLKQAVSLVTVWQCGHGLTSPTPTSPTVSLQQMVQFGQNPSQGTLLRAGQFLLGMCWQNAPTSPHLLYSLSCTRAEELPVRLAHRAKELDELPHDLSDMPSIQKVKNWYAQSFEVRNHVAFLVSKINRTTSLRN
jgi:hypothetical protein